jgi:hypothetical protein
VNPKNLLRSLTFLIAGQFFTTDTLTKVKSKKVPTKWSWKEDQQKAMDQVIEKLTSPPILAYADYTLPFVLHTDAINVGLGAVLYQKQGGNDRVMLNIPLL